MQVLEHLAVFHVVGLADRGRTDGFAGIEAFERDNDAGEVPVLRRFEFHHHCSAFCVTVCTDPVRLSAIPQSSRA